MRREAGTRCARGTGGVEDGDGVRSTLVSQSSRHEAQRRRWRAQQQRARRGAMLLPPALRASDLLRATSPARGSAAQEQASVPAPRGHSPLRPRLQAARGFAAGRAPARGAPASGRHRRPTPEAQRDGRRACSKPRAGVTQPQRRGAAGRKKAGRGSASSSLRCSRGVLAMRRWPMSWRRYSLSPTLRPDGSTVVHSGQAAVPWGAGQRANAV